MEKIEVEKWKQTKIRQLLEIDNMGTYSVPSMKILTCRQVAEMLQAKPSTIYAWAEQGRIPSIKVNGLLRFIEAEILDWLRTYTNLTIPCYNRGIQARSSRKGGRR